MTAAVVFDEELAAIVVALMYSGGQLLESYRRGPGPARHDRPCCRGRRAPPSVTMNGDRLTEVPLADIRRGDRLMVRKGDIIPVDGMIAEGVAVLDESTLTGESRPVKHAVGAIPSSPAPPTRRSVRPRRVRDRRELDRRRHHRLVEQAQQSRAPMTRLADRYAIVFLVFTLLIAGIAWFVPAMSCASSPFWSSRPPARSFSPCRWRWSPA